MVNAIESGRSIRCGRILVVSPGLSAVRTHSLESPVRPM